MTAEHPPKPRKIKKQKGGFADMDPKLQRQAASLGGHAHSIEYMREIGKRGGIAAAKKRKEAKDELEARKTRGS